MRSLGEVQQAFLGVITSPDGVEAALWDAGGLERLVVGDDRLSAAGRIGVYADMYRLRLRAALAATFPFTAKLVGDAAFDALAGRFFARHPSRSPSLRDAGAAFPGFLAARGCGWAADLARLEWARHDVFDDVDEPVLDVAAARALGPLGLEVRLVRAHRLVGTRHAIAPAWRDLADGREPGVPPVEPSQILVWREGVSVFHRRVESPEAEALAAAAAGLPFAALCETLADGSGQLAASLLGRWLSDRLLAAL